MVWNTDECNKGNLRKLKFLGMSMEKVYKHYHGSNFLICYMAVFR